MIVYAWNLVNNEQKVLITEQIINHHYRRSVLCKMVTFVWPPIVFLILRREIHPGGRTNQGLFSCQGSCDFSNIPNNPLLNYKISHGLLWGHCCSVLKTTGGGGLGVKDAKICMKNIIPSLSYDFSKIRICL